MAERRSPLYLERASYRRRRLIDAQRLLPILLFGLWLLPLLWGGEGTEQPLGAGSRAFVHVFVVWALGIVAAGWVAWLLMRGGAQTEERSGGSTPQRGQTQPHKSAKQGRAAQRDQERDRQGDRPRDQPGLRPGDRV